MPRLFIGIPVPDIYHEQLASLASDLDSRLQSKVRWTKPGNSHITLKFLGDVDDSRVPDIKTALSAIDFPAFLMRAGGCGCFPSEKRPRVLWTGITKGTKLCVNLAGVVADALMPLGFEKENRPFKCHLTLGRIKRLAGDDWGTCLREAGGLWPGFEVNRFVLWESELTPTGAVYSVVEEFWLRGNKE